MPKKPRSRSSTAAAVCRGLRCGFARGDEKGDCHKRDQAVQHVNAPRLVRSHKDTDTGLVRQRCPIVRSLQRASPTKTKTNVDQTGLQVPETPGT